MLILNSSHGPQSNTTDNKIQFNASGAVQLLTRKNLPNPPPPPPLNASEDEKNKYRDEYIQYEIYINNGLEKVKAKILTVFQSGSPKLYIRLINCAVIVTTFMIAIIEQDPRYDSVVELIDATTTNGGLTQDLIENQVNGSSKEIKIQYKDPLKTELTDDILLNGLSLVSNPTNKFIKIFNKDTKKKMNYVLDFSLNNVDVPTSFLNLRKTSNSNLSSTALELKFSQLINVFKQTMNSDIFDESSLLGQLNSIKSKNKKMSEAIQEIKKYLLNSQGNLTNYNKN